MISFGIDTTNLKAKVADLAQVKHKAAPLLEDYFVKMTPVRSGNARANTQLQGDNIVANYPYAFVLDAGRSYRDGQMRGSTQAPRGMSDPTKEFAKKLIPQLVSQIGNRRK
jgi:hypothetical protein